MSKDFLTPRDQRRIEEVHVERTLDTLDTKATFNWKDDPEVPTACWSFHTGTHRIQMNPTIVSLVDHPKRLKEKRSSRKELKYAKSTYLHEVGHGLYTTRLFREFLEFAASEKVGFPLINLLEDARIEGLMRGRRPTYKDGKQINPQELTYDGTLVDSESYGIRKFDWLYWEKPKMREDSPESVMLALIQAEGTKVNIEALKQLYVSTFGDINKGFPGPKKTIPFKTHKGTYRIGPCKDIGFGTFLSLWRQLAGRNSHHRYPTTESILPFCKAWQELFPGNREIPQLAGPGEDFLIAIKVATGEDPKGEKFQLEDKEEEDHGGETVDEDPIDPHDDKKKLKGTGTNLKANSEDESTIETVPSSKQAAQMQLAKLGLSGDYFSPFGH